MNLWNEKKEDITRKINDYEQINKSGVYNSIIEWGCIHKAQKSGAMCVVLKIKSGEKGKRVAIFFRSKEGELLEFGQTLLNRLLYLAKTSVNKMTLEERTTTYNDGGKVTREYIKELDNLNVGVVLEIKGENSNIKDFYHIKTMKTVEEIANNTEGIRVAEYKKRYGQLETEEDTGTDEFPF